MKEIGPLIIKGKEVCIAFKTENLLESSLGLMFKNKLGYGTGLLLTFPSQHRINCSIHTFFMKFPIDVVFIDSNNCIVDKETIQPWKIYFPRRGCKYALELNKGVIETEKIRICDKIEGINK